MLWKKTLIEHHEHLEKFHHWRCHGYCRKAVKAFQPQTINSCWWKLCPDFTYDVTGFIAEPIKEILKESWYQKKKVRDEGFQNTDLRKIQELTDIKPEELKVDNLMEISASRTSVTTRRNTRRSCARKQTDNRRPDRKKGSSYSRLSLWLLLRHGLLHGRESQN